MIDTERIETICKVNDILREEMPEYRAQSEIFPQKIEPQLPDFCSRTLPSER